MFKQIACYQNRMLQYELFVYVKAHTVVMNDSYT